MQTEIDVVLTCGLTAPKPYLELLPYSILEGAIEARLATDGAGTAPGLSAVATIVCVPLGLQESVV